ncbi:MAG: response regulator transcription factor [Clostridiales bacterium]|nr:response regulator transcription factor [Clostridiales bacterium]
MTYQNVTIHLTSREFECLKLLARGHSFKTAASAMNISPKTIEFHLNNVKHKLRVYSKAKLIELFYQSELAWL